MASKYDTDMNYRKRVDEYKAAQKTAREWLANATDLDNEVRRALIKVVGLPNGTNRPSGAREQILEMLKNGAINEFDIFKKFKYGQAEMKAIIRYFIKDVAPKERVWIAYDEDEGDYYVFSEGEETPDNWTGYIPKDV